MGKGTLVPVKSKGKVLTSGMPPGMPVNINVLAVMVGNGADVPVNSSGCDVINGTVVGGPVKVSICTLMVGNGTALPEKTRGCTLTVGRLLRGPVKLSGCVVITRSIWPVAASGASTGGAVGVGNAVDAGFSAGGAIGARRPACARQLLAVNATPTANPRLRQMDDSVECFGCCFITGNISNFWATQITQ